MSAVGIAKNMVIGEAIVTVFEPMVLCRKCKQHKPKSDFKGYQTCADCREEARRYQFERKAKREQQRKLKREREELWDKCIKLSPDDYEWAKFSRWQCYYHDVMEGGEKFGPTFLDLDDPEFDIPLWYELLTIWNNLGRPEAPEDWQPEV